MFNDLRSATSAGAGHSEDSLTPDNTLFRLKPSARCSHAFSETKNVCRTLLAVRGSLPQFVQQPHAPVQRCHTLCCGCLPLHTACPARFLGTLLASAVVASSIVSSVGVRCCLSISVSVPVPVSVFVSVSLSFCRVSCVLCFVSCVLCLVSCVLCLVSMSLSYVCVCLCL